MPSTRTGPRGTNPSPANQPTIFAALNAPSPPPSFTKQPPPPRIMRGKTSAVWEHAVLDEDRNPPVSIIGREKNQPIIRCKIWFASSKEIKQWKVDGGNPHFRKHMQEAHNITIFIAADEAMEKYTIVI